MPTNKNALTRIAILDKLLSRRHAHFSIDELTEKLNEELESMFMEKVTRRCVQKDIHYLEFESTFLPEIERYTLAGKKCIRYKDPAYSVFHKQLTDDEEYLLQEALKMLGQFDGLPNLEALDSLRASLSVKRTEPIISISRNPYIEQKNLFAQLFTAISQKQSIILTYHKFQCEPKQYKLCPYLLKEYNHRWYLLAWNVELDTLHTFPLDRMDAIVFAPEVPYNECEIDLDEYFDDVIGITVPNEDVQHIVCWVSDKEKDYIISKPFHGSIRYYKDENDKALHKQYPQLKGGIFFSLDVIPNYELYRILSSFGHHLLVLSPAFIRDELHNKAQEVADAYKKIK